VRLLGLILLIVLSPLILILCALVKLTSSGPAIFRQVRVGKGGRRFNLLKLRTMYDKAEEATGPVWCLPGDSRITPLGRMLRFFHLDELPQLVNVVRGEMDLVGPRPERPEIIASERLLDRVANYNDRHLVLPGVTGLAQINLPPDQTVDCVHRKVALDIEYIRTASLALDIRILTCTALRMLGVRYGIAVRYLRLDRPEIWRTGRRSHRFLAGASGRRADHGHVSAAASSLASNGAMGLNGAAAPFDEFEAEVVPAFSHKLPR
jgi:lipopolysaccharide/colanic/teichoic acid biosynthesis glycosyltransferase